MDIQDMTKIEPGRGRGRPASKTPKLGAGGKGRVTTISISDELRTALEEEAKNTGRPMSHIAEKWMEEARNGRAQFQQQLGGHAAAAALEKLVDIAREITDRASNPKEAQIAIRSAWIKALPHLFPRQLHPDDIRRDLPPTAEAWAACQNVLHAIGAKGESSQVWRRAVEPLRTASNPFDDGKHSEALFRTLVEPPENKISNKLMRPIPPGEDALLALEQLTSAATESLPEIETAIALVAKCVNFRNSALKATIDAEKWGQEIVDAMFLDPTTGSSE